MIIDEKFTQVEPNLGNYASNYDPFRITTKYNIFPFRQNKDLS